MAAAPEDIATAQRIVDELNDTTKFMIGNPANASPAYWAPPAIPGVFDWRNGDLWVGHGEKCYSKAQTNPAGMQRFREASDRKVPIAIINELRKAYQRDKTLIDKNVWLSSKFKRETADIIGTATGEKRKVCAKCGKPVMIAEQPVANPTIEQWALIDHEPACLSDKAMVKGRDGKFVEGDTPKWQGKYSVKTVTPEGEMSRECQQFIETQGAGYGTADMYEFICKFRCNDHAAMTIYLLSRTRVYTHYEIIRNGNDSMDCHYYVVMGRRRGDGDTHETNILAGKEGQTPSQVLGPDAIILDAWSTKHGHKFPTGEEQRGIITDPSVTDKWLIRPMEFGNALFPIAVYNLVHDRAPQRYSGLGVGSKETV